MTGTELKTLLYDLVASGTFWGGVGAVAGVAAAVAAFMTISASNAVRKEELESRRPYFVIKKPHFSIKDENAFLLNINIVNEGVRPASRVRYEMDVFPVHKAHGNDGPINALSIEIEHKFEHSSDLPSGVPFPWWLDYPLRKDIAPLYFKLAIRYVDGMLGKSYEQTFFMRWDGAQSGSAASDLVFAPQLQADAMSEYLMLRDATR